MNFGVLTLAFTLAGATVKTYRRRSLLHGFGITDEEKKQRAREVAKRWKETHPERVKELERERYKKDSERIKERVKEWRKAHPEKAREHSRKHSSKYSKKYAEKARAATARWRKENPEKSRDSRRKWIEEHGGREHLQKQYPEQLQRQRELRASRSGDVDRRRIIGQHTRMHNLVRRILKAAYQEATGWGLTYGEIEKLYSYADTYRTANELVKAFVSPETIYMSDRDRKVFRDLIKKEIVKTDADVKKLHCEIIAKRARESMTAMTTAFRWRG